MLLDAAFAESSRHYRPTFGVDVGGAEIGVDLGGAMSGIDERHEAEAMQTARELYQTHVLRSAPILRALGFTAEATLIDSTNFVGGAGWPSNLAASLKAVRAKI